MAVSADLRCKLGPVGGRGLQTPRSINFIRSNFIPKFTHAFPSCSISSKSMINSKLILNSSPNSCFSICNLFDHQNNFSSVCKMLASSLLLLALMVMSLFFTQRSAFAASYGRMGSSRSSSSRSSSSKSSRPSRSNQSWRPSYSNHGDLLGLGITNIRYRDYIYRSSYDNMECMDCKCYQGKLKTSSRSSSSESSRPSRSSRSSRPFPSISSCLTYLTYTRCLRYICYNKISCSGCQCYKGKRKTCTDCDCLKKIECSSSDVDHSSSISNSECDCKCHGPCKCMCHSAAIGIAVIFSIVLVINAFADVHSEDDVPTENNVQTSAANVRRGSVLMVQVGILDKKRELQRKLNRISETADTYTTSGLNSVKKEVVNALLEHHDSCHFAYLFAKYDDMEKYSRPCFRGFLETELSKFKKEEETFVNVDGFRCKKDSPGNVNRIGNEYLVVTLLVLADGEYRIPSVQGHTPHVNKVDIRTALQKIRSIRRSNLEAVEVLWTPQTENDSISEQDLHRDFGLLMRPVKLIKKPYSLLSWF